MPSFHDSVYALAPIKKHPADNFVFGWNFTDYLRPGETITSVTSISAQPAGLLFGTPAPNASSFDGDEGQSVDAGKGVLCNVSGGTKGEYDGDIVFVTNQRPSGVGASFRFVVP